MEVSALDRATTAKPTPSAPLAGAGVDLFGQMLDSLAPVTEPHAAEYPADDDIAPEETVERDTTEPERSTADKNPAELAFLGQQRQIRATFGARSGDTDTPTLGTTEIALPQSDGTERSATPANAAVAGPTGTDTTPLDIDATETVIIAAQSPVPAAAVQAANPLSQRAATQTDKQQSQQGPVTDPSMSTEGQTSLRAGRDEAMAQGNGQFQASGADKTSSGTPAAGDEQPAQTAQNAERPTVNGESPQQTARPEAPSLNLPKVPAPTPTTAPAPIVAASTPTTNIPLDQTSQLTAGARSGDIQSVTAASRPAANQAATPQRSQPAAQIAVHIRNGLKASADSIHVRLQPAELGRVEVRMQIDGDKNVQAVITVEKSETLDFLERDSRVLQRALEDAGFKTDRDSFTFQHQSTPDPGDRPQNERQFAGATNGDSADGPADAEGSPIANSRSSHDGLVDIEV